MPDFLSSLLLVAVAQIPLLLKLWLDHRLSVSGFKLELYKRQVDAMMTLSTKICRTQRNAEAIITLLKEGSLPEEDDSSLGTTLGQPYSDDDQALMQAALDYELLLPAQISVDLHAYVACSVQLWAKGFVPKVATSKKSPHVIFSEQQQLCNVLLNRMRQFCGTDTLSEDTLAQFASARAGQTRLLLRTYDEGQVVP